MRSAISLISGEEVGNHPLIKRFCKGMAVLKPPCPKYDFIWDPAPAIQKLASIYPYESLSLDIITKERVLLLTLATGQRLQTLIAFRLSHRHLNDKLIIKVPDRIKTSAPGRSQPVFSFTPFIGNENLYIYEIVKHYLLAAKDLRALSSVAFFVSLTKPHKAVSSQTISRWIKLSLSDCGIETDVFSAHSTRHASTYLAARKGALDIIKRAVGWSGQSRVFRAIL
ncbi:PREDICTED: uncharacterized protein LOC105556641 [Vollenhovia emeryi]|uniref:uncharacterized protein LOC105556641 n=1 Tax=Vollenhovia emeryi TaxID=411798 RepID=UPI0005F4E603|nr:PREDICTED: uncharacterized protein LOC105556641 [Vollenhovia emeryi]